MGGFPALLGNARLVRMKNCCALIDRIRGDYVMLHPFAGAVLAMCNGSMSLENILETCAKAFSTSSMSEDFVRRTLERCERFIGWESQQEKSEWRYYPPDFLYEPVSRKDDYNFPLEKPLAMTLSLTNECNMRCIYCFRAAGSRLRNELSKKELFGLVDQAAKMELKYCSLTGGEPTLHPDFEEVAIRMLRNDIYPYISTNGTRLSETTLSRLKHAGLETMQFSLDAGEPPLFDKIVGVPGYFKKVLEAIKMTKRLGYRVFIKAVATPFNASKIGGLFSTCADLGVDFILVEAFSPGLHGSGNKKLLLSHDLALQVRSMVEEAQQSFSGSMAIAPFAVPKKWSGPEDIIYCGGMYTAFVVQSDGTVSACEQVNTAPLCFGNIREKPLSEIWTSMRVLEFLNPNQAKVQEPCGSCKHFRRCRSGCFNYSLQYSSDLYAPDPRCWKAKLGKSNPLMEE